MYPVYIIYMQYRLYVVRDQTAECECIQMLVLTVRFQPVTYLCVCCILAHCPDTVLFTTTVIDNFDNCFFKRAGSTWILV